MVTGPYGGDAQLDLDVRTFFAGLGRVTRSRVPCTDNSATLRDVFRRRALEAWLAGTTPATASVENAYLQRTGEVAGFIDVGTRPVEIVDSRHGAYSFMLSIAQSSLQRSGYREPVRAVTMSREQVLALQAAMSVAQRQNHVIAATAIRRVVAVLVIDAPDIPSCTLSDLPGVVVLGARLLAEADLTLIAEAMVHEGLHEKFARLRLVRRVFTISDEPGLPRMYLPWSGQANEAREFNAVRLLSAYHVYAHLSVFAQGAADADALGRVMTYWERARFMDIALRVAGIAQGLNDDGLAIRDWLHDVVLAPRLWSTGALQNMTARSQWKHLDTESIQVYYRAEEAV